ncbi:MAG: helix-hairpin-helix domain-containing protein [Bacteroidales bacterium]
MKFPEIRYYKLIRIIIALVFYFFLNLQGLNAQNPVIEQIVEDLNNQSENENADYTDLIEDLVYFLTNPLNLNNATSEDLEKVQFLSNLQIENLLNYVARNHGLKTIYELQLIEGFDYETIKKLIPFVKVEEVRQVENLKPGKVIRYANHKILAETKFLLQDQKGYNNIEDTLASGPQNKYLGNKYKYLVRYRFNYKNRIYAGLTAEKDPGEDFNTGKNKYGFDFYSAYFQLKNTGIIKDLTIGDFQVKFGQGLILWTGFGIGKSSEVLNLRKKGQGLRYYSSTDENNFMRGIGTTLKFKQFEYTVFFSKKKIDANTIASDTIENEEEQISSLQNTGYHRTYSELADRKKIDETIIGSKLGFSVKNLRLGLNFVAYQLNVDILKSSKPYKYYDFNGRQNYNASFDYNFNYKTLNLFGEAAISKNGRLAIQNGLISQVVPTLSFSLIHRYYQEGYAAYYSNSFSENTRITNENGMFYGIEFHPVRRVVLKAFADSYRFPWLKYQVDAPSYGNEFFVQAGFNPNRNTEMYFKWRSENKPSNYSNGISPVNLIENEKKESYRYHITYRLSNQLTLRNRIEFTRYQQNEIREYGFMIFQDVNLDLRNYPLSFYFRYAVFDATYNSRIYAYENELLFNYSVPQYSGKGSHFYIMIKIDPLENLEIRARFSQYFYPKETKIGSGLDEINGNYKSEAKIQIIYRL